MYTVNSRHVDPSKVLIERIAGWERLQAFPEPLYYVMLVAQIA